MTGKLTRRRFLSISAAAAVSAGTPAWARTDLTWRGRAMGAEATMVLSGAEDNAATREVFRSVEQELLRLERIFSLYNHDSQIVHLNKTGFLAAPAPDMLALLSLCETLHVATQGAFDPTLQPLWFAHAMATAQGRILTESETAQAWSKVGWSRLSFDSYSVRFDRQGCGLTLNGIAQGYITDRIAGLLRDRGMTDVLVDMGEIVAIGPRRWDVGIAEPGGNVVDRITLKERSIATSAPLGTPLVSDRQMGHILDPRDHMAHPKYRLVSVSALSAALADGLSTAFCLMSEDEIGDCLTTFADAKMEKLI